MNIFIAGGRQPIGEPCRGSLLPTPICRSSRSDTIHLEIITNQSPNQPITDAADLDIEDDEDTDLELDIVSEQAPAATVDAEQIEYQHARAANGDAAAAALIACENSQAAHTEAAPIMSEQAHPTISPPTSR